MKAKQIGQFDEGIDESSCDEDEDKKKENTEKYFANGLLSQKKPNSKKTIDEIIRDSKEDKYQKSIANEKDANATEEANKLFKQEIRFHLSELSALAKAQSKTNESKTVKNSFGDIFQKNYETLIYAPRLAKADQKSIKQTPISTKENEKIVNLKLKKLREHLAKEGITNDDEAEDFLKETMPDSELDESNDEEESVEGDVDEDEESLEGEESETESVDNDEESIESGESDNSGDSDEIELPDEKNSIQEDTIKNLKK